MAEPMTPEGPSRENKAPTFLDFFSSSWTEKLFSLCIWFSNMGNVRLPGNPKTSQKLKWPQRRQNQGWQRFWVWMLLLPESLDAASSKVKPCLKFPMMEGNEFLLLFLRSSSQSHSAVSDSLQPHGRWASLSFTISPSLLKLMSIESVIPFNHLILCHPLLLLPSIFPRIRVKKPKL